MHTLAIVVIVGLIALYVGGKVLAIAFEVISSLLEGTTAAAKNTPNLLLRILGRRKIGAKVQIDKRLLASADKSLRAKEIECLKVYKPNVGYIQNIFDSVKYESVLSAIDKRVVQNKAQKHIDDLSVILKPNKLSVRQKIEGLVNKKEFPLPEPKKLNQVQAPPSIALYQKLDIEEPAIKLPLWSGWLERLNVYVYKEFEKEINSVKIASEELKKLIKLEKEQEEEISRSYGSAVGRYEKALIAEKQSYEYSLSEWRKAKELWDRGVEADQYAIQNLLFAFNGGDIEQQTRLILNNIELPKWMPCNYEIKYDGDTKILIVEHEFVDIGSIDWIKTVELKNGATAKPLNQKELKSAVDLLYPSVTLRLAYELASQLNGDVEAIAINGWADYTVKATGNIKRAYCSSLLATIEDIRKLNLLTLEPLAAFASLNGNVARSLELTPIAPKIKLNTNDARYVEDKEVLGGLSSEQNLASMDWQDFEHLCRELFERLFSASGAIVKVTQASRDMGVDAVVHNADPILGGKIVIQAKRYVNTVDVSAVRDLWGTVNHEGAMKGILVTTSQYGPDSYAFIQNKPLQLINGNELLGLLEQYGYKFRINLNEARQFLKDNNAFPFNK